MYLQKCGYITSLYHVPVIDLVDFGTTVAKLEKALAFVAWWFKLQLLSHLEGLSNCLQCHKTKNSTNNNKINHHHHNNNSTEAATTPTIETATTTTTVTKTPPPKMPTSTETSTNRMLSILNRSLSSKLIICTGVKFLLVVDS